MSVPQADQLRLSHILADDLQVRIDWAYNLEQEIATLSGGGLTSWGLASTAQYVHAGDPNGAVTAVALGDFLIDTSTPALWLADGPGTAWTQASGGGGGGAVTSVNSQTGAVVLTYTDVGADPAGAAATAETNAEAYADSLAPNYDPAGSAAAVTKSSIGLGNVSNTPISAAGPQGDAAHTQVLTWNAAGQLTAVTNTAIAIANTAVSGLGTMSTQAANNVNITGGSVTGITDLPIADGGTGASTAAAALAAFSGQAGADFSLNSHKLTSVSDPTSAQDAATKAYVDLQVSGLGDKAAVAYASTSALPANTYSNGTSGVGATLTGTANGPLLIDGVTILVAQAGERVLVAGEAAPANNGWYTITQVGVVAVSPYILTRATDSDQAAEIGAGYLTPVTAPNTVTPGSANNGKVFISVAADPFTVGTTSLTFSQVGGTYTAGNGIGLSGSAFSIDTSVTVDKTTAQTLTNKTLTSPAITTPTGIVATDIASGTFAIGRIPTGTDGTHVPLGGVITGAGPTGDASHTLALTYNAAGQLTAVTNNAIAIAESQVTSLVSDLAAKAPLASPALTGTPTAPTAAPATNSTQLATTAYADAIAALKANVLTPTAVKTATTYTAAAGDFVPCDTTSNAITVTLPNAPADKTVVGVKHVIQAGTNSVTIACAGSDVFNKAGGATSASLPNLAESYIFQYKASGAIWYIVEHDSPRTAQYFDALAALNPTSLTALQTLTAVQAAQIAAEYRAGLGYYVGQGCVYSPNGTPTKLDVTAGMILAGAVDVVCSAQTAINTTIASMADATNPKWVLVEIDSSGVTQFNQGTAAASPAIPTETASRVPVALLHIPANATNVDTLLTTSNGNAKLIDIKVVNRGPSPTGWEYDQNTWTFASATSFTISATDATGYLTPGTFVSWRDGTNTPGYGVVYSSSFSTNTTVTLITTSDYPIANATMTAPRFSYAAAPQGFPSQFNWTPVLAGCSKNPSGTVQLSSVASTIASSLFTKSSHGLANGTVITFSGLSTTTGVSNVTNYYVVSTTTNTFQVSLTKGGSAITLGGTADAAIIVSVITIYTWATNGKNITLTIRQGVNGTSSSTTHTATLPATAVTSTGGTWLSAGSNFDNGAVSIGSLVVISAGTTVAIANLASGANTASGSCGYLGGIVTYPFA